MAENNTYVEKGTVIDGRYEITFPISHPGAYRAKDSLGASVRLELTERAAISPMARSSSGSPLFAEHLNCIEHPTIGDLIETIDTVIKGIEFAVSVFRFRGSETVAERIERDGPLPPFKAVSIVCDILGGLKTLHAAPEPLVHNGISHHTVSLDYTSGSESPVLFGFDNLRSIHDSRDSIDRSRLSVFHAAPELAAGVFMPKSDIYSVGALLFHMIWGFAPWYSERIAKASTDDAFRLLADAQRRRLNFGPVSNFEVQTEFILAIRRALSVDPSRRYQSVDEFASALRLEFGNDGRFGYRIASKDLPPNVGTFEPEQSANGGFKAIAGMEDLKATLHNEVIRPIRERERFKKFGIPLINGILLYGPPGCGKTYIAERLAEEIGYSFMLVKPSDLGSPYVHGGQLKIGELFTSAEEQAPCMIFVDEIDAVLPSRDSWDLSHSYAAEVNEFLAQLANCGEREIFVLAATNKPDKMDVAALRAGRMDKIIHIPPPDKILRKEMFQMHLASRPAAFSIDCEFLADKTDKYVSADIFKIVIEASRKAEKADTKITQDFLLQAIKENPPSVPASELDRYEKLRTEWEGQRTGSQGRSAIGFIQPGKTD